MQPRQARVLLIAIAASGIILFGISRLLPKANTIVKLAPSVATMTLDGTKYIKAGNLRLTPGDHTIVANMNGFANTTKKFTTPASGNITVFVVLDPNSQAGYDYLKQHPTEEYLRESLGGQQFSQTSKQFLAANPIIKVLPYVSSDHTFRVDYGSGANQAGVQQTIFITAADDAANRKALGWIQSKGYVLSSLNIVTITEPMLSHLPYRTTDFSLTADFVSGQNNQPKLTIDAKILLSQADMSSQDQAVALYKQEVLNYINSLGLNPSNYTINYSVGSA